MKYVSDLIENEIKVINDKIFTTPIPRNISAKYRIRSEKFNILWEFRLNRTIGNDPTRINYLYTLGLGDKLIKFNDYSMDSDIEKLSQRYWRMKKNKL